MTELKKYTVIMMEEEGGLMQTHVVNAFDSKDAICMAEHSHFYDMPRTSYQACVYEGHLDLVDEV